MPQVITEFLADSTFEQLQTQCADVAENTEASIEARREAHQNLVLLKAITKPNSPTTHEDNAAVRARVIQFLSRGA